MDPDGAFRLTKRRQMGKCASQGIRNKQTGNYSDN